VEPADRDFKETDRDFKEKDRDFKVLGDGLQEEFQAWMVAETQANVRPLAKVTAKDHVMSMNSLVRRVLGRAGVRATFQDRRSLRTVLRGKLQALKQEAKKLTHGRVRAYCYFLKYLNLEREMQSGAPALPISGLVLLEKEVKKSFKAWLRQGGREGGREDAAEVEATLTVALYVLHQAYAQIRADQNGRGGRGGQGGREGGGVGTILEQHSDLLPSLPPSLLPSLRPFIPPSSPPAQRSQPSP
jgi:hypothetical protein